MSCIASFPSKLPDARCGVERLLAPNVPHLSPVCGHDQVRERGVFACICVSILCRHLSLACFFFNIMREQAQMRDPLCVYMSERLRGFRTSQGTSVPTYRSFHFADHFRIVAIEFVHLHTSRCTRMLSKHHEACRHGNPFRLRNNNNIYTYTRREKMLHTYSVSNDLEHSFSTLPQEPSPSHQHFITNPRSVPRTSYGVTVRLLCVCSCTHTPDAAISELLAFPAAT